MFLRNGNPEEQEDEDSDEEQGRYEERVLLSEIGEAIQKKYPLERQVKGKFTASLDFDEYDSDMMNSYYRRIWECLAEYEPEETDFKKEKNIELEEMADIMAQIVNDYDEE